MIRQLGFPSLFILLSAAETKWPKLLQALGKVLHKTEHTNDDIQNMDWNTKVITLITKDPVTIVQYFTNRYKQFKDLVIDSYHCSNMVAPLTY